MPGILLGLLQPLLGLIVPSLVSEAEKAFTGSSKSGPSKRQWVIDGVNEVLAAMIKKMPLPSWAKTVEGPVVELLDVAIDAALDKAEGK